ncbi:lipase, partial [Salmonella enterica]|nr:lipase [Salmonella enterica subsp. enterica]
SSGDITRAESIQYINAENNLFSITDITPAKNDLKDSVKPVGYSESYYAEIENDYTISSFSSNSWFYSDVNDSNISVAGDNNNIVSGYGSDIINLNGNDNTLLFYGDFGNDTIYNLSASDSLIFMANKHIADNDSYLNHLSFVDENALLTYGESSITLVGVNADMLAEMYIAVA